MTSGHAERGVPAPEEMCARGRLLEDLGRVQSASGNRLRANVGLQVPGCKSECKSSRKSACTPAHQSTLTSACASKLKPTWRSACPRISPRGGQRVSPRISQHRVRAARPFLCPGFCGIQDAPEDAVKAQPVSNAKPRRPTSSATRRARGAGQRRRCPGTGSP